MTLKLPFFQEIYWLSSRYLILRETQRRTELIIIMLLPHFDMRELQADILCVNNSKIVHIYVTGISREVKNNNTYLSGFRRTR